MRQASTRLKPGRISVFAMYFFFLSVVARTFTESDGSYAIQQVLLQLTIFVILLSIVIWVTKLPVWLIHLLLVLQIVLIVSIQKTTLQFDFSNILFVLVSFQIASIFEGKSLAIWIIFLLPATCLTQMYSLGALEGLSKSFSNMAGEISIFAYFIALREIESTRERQRQAVQELQEVHARLEEYAGQVEELAAIDERNWLARELHDSVSQTLFSISLNIRAAQILLKKGSDLIQKPLEDLQVLTESALAQIRSLITQMRQQE
jgi:signal transduction histidine kinase